VMHLIVPLAFHSRPGIPVACLSDTQAVRAEGKSEDKYAIDADQIWNVEVPKKQPAARLDCRVR